MIISGRFRIDRVPTEPYSIDMNKQRIASLVRTIRVNLEEAQTGTFAARKCANEQAAAAAGQLLAAGVAIPQEFAGRL
jgi:hypothetical protein